MTSFRERAKGLLREGLDRVDEAAAKLPELGADDLPRTPEAPAPSPIELPGDKPVPSVNWELPDDGDSAGKDAQPASLSATDRIANVISGLGRLGRRDRSRSTPDLGYSLPEDSPDDRAASSPTTTAPNLELGFSLPDDDPEPGIQVSTSEPTIPIPPQEWIDDLPD